MAAIAAVASGAEDWRGHAGLGGGSATPVPAAGGLGLPAGRGGPPLGSVGEGGPSLGRPVSERQREMCHWTVLWTNVPASG